VDRNWALRARCREDGPELFYDPERADEARLLCAACPVRSYCLQTALAIGETEGIWGGLDGAERSVLIGARSAGARRGRLALRCTCGASVTWPISQVRLGDTPPIAGTVVSGHDEGRPVWALTTRDARDLAGRDELHCRAGHFVGNRRQGEDLILLDARMVTLHAYRRPAAAPAAA
jgi:WhiB family transcriptional regulator, redox-sensing transcriptional regulator